MSRLPTAFPQGFDASLPVSEQAFFWVVYLEAGACSDADHDAFDDWLDADDGHGPAYREAAQLWRTLAASPRVDALPAAVMDVRPRRTAPRRRVTAGIAGAALLAASLGIGLLVMPRLGAELGGAAQTDYASVNYDTAIGEIRRVVLADGSELVLGGDTALEVRYTETGRQASILKGQVFLDVVHEPARPFAITAGAARVHILGTSLDIRRGPRGSTVSVIEGRVGVGAATLTAGQQILVGDSGDLGAVRPFDPRQVLGWQEQRFYFENASLEDLVADLNRYARKPIALEGEGLKDLNISASFSMDQSRDMLAGLAEAVSLELVDEADRVVIRRPAPL